MNTIFKQSRLLCAVCLVLCLSGAVWAQEPVKFHGDVEILPNGDATFAMHFDMPMMQYQRMRDNVSNLYLMLREIASQRAAAEVTDKNASYDDAKHAVDFTMTVKGAARNLGDHWEFEVEEGLDFSNFDESQRTLYFNEVTEGFAGNLRGSYSLKLPDQASKMSWQAGPRVVRWELPGPGGGGGMGLWLAALALIALGLVATGASFVIKS